MRLLIIVSQPHVRSALQYLLSLQSDIQLVGVVGGGPGLASKLAVAAPEVVLLDWDLPGGAATGLITVGRRLPNPARIVVFSEQEEAERAALAAGAEAFVYQGDASDTLLDVLRRFQSPERSLPGGRENQGHSSAPPGPPTASH